MRAIGSVGLALATGACINPVGVSDHHRIEGSGFLVTEARGVSGFDGITVSGAGLVIVEQTGYESLHITTDDNILGYIVTEVRGGMLVMGPRSNTNFSPSDGIVYHLTVRSLNEISISGAVEVEALDIDTDGLIVHISGATHVDVAGAVDWQDVQTSGASSYWGRDLFSRVATVQSSGSSAVVVNVSDHLTASASGVALIEYVGRPRVTGSVSGGATIRRY
jgi:hypothetical protein